MANVSGIRWGRDVKCDLCGGAVHDPLRKEATFGCTFVRCRDCGLMFYNPRYAEQYIAENYLSADSARNEAEAIFLSDIPLSVASSGAEGGIAMPHQHYRGILDEQAAWFRKLNGGAPESLFEVGASAGWYMKIARDEFLQSAGRPLVQGCSSNAFAAKLARQVLGLDVRGSTLALYETIPDQIFRFSLVGMFGSIERSYTPFKDIRKLRDLTAPHGVLFLKTFLEELDPKGMHVHPLVNTHHFTETTLERALVQAGWKILDFDKERERVHGLVTVFAERLP